MTSTVKAGKMCMQCPCLLIGLCRCRIGMINVTFKWYPLYTVPVSCSEARLVGDVGVVGLRRQAVV